MRSAIMRALEAIPGFAISVVTMLILVVGGIFTFGSLRKYLKAKAM